MNTLLRVTITFWDEEEYPLTIDSKTIQTVREYDTSRVERLFMVMRDESEDAVYKGIKTSVAMDLIKNFEVEIIE